MNEVGIHDVDSVGNCGTLVAFSLGIRRVYSLPDEEVLRFKTPACDLMVSYVTSGQVQSWAALRTARCAMKASEANEILERAQSISFEYLYEDCNESAFVALSRVLEMQFLKNNVESDVKHLPFLSASLKDPFEPFSIRVWVPDYQRHGICMLCIPDQNFVGMIIVPGSTTTKDILMCPPRAELIGGIWKRNEPDLNGTAVYVELNAHFRNSHFQPLDIAAALINSMFPLPPVLPATSG